MSSRHPICPVPDRIAFQASTAWSAHGHQDLRSVLCDTRTVMQTDDSAEEPDLAAGDRHRAGYADPPPGGPLAGRELTQMTELLARYAAHELDQWEQWQIGTPYDTVYICISRAPVGGPDDRSHYQPIWPIPPHPALPEGP